MRSLSILPSLLLLSTVALGHGYNQTPSYHQGYSYPSYPVSYPSYPQYYQNNYNTQFIYPAAIPLYSVGYQQPSAVISGAVGYSQQIVTQTSSVQSMLSASQDLAFQEKFLQFMEVMIARQQSGTRGQAQQEQPHVAILRRDCAKCHSGVEASGKFQLFDSNDAFVEPDGAGVGKIMFRLATKNAKLRMPPNGRMNPDDKDAVTEALMTAPEKAISPKKEEGF